MRRYFHMVIAAILLAALGLGGCAPRQTPEPMPTLTPPVIEETDPAENPGSLFDANRSEFLYEDNRATRVGDIVMVEVAETSASRIKSETSAKRSNALDNSVTAYPSVGTLGNIPLAGSLGAEVGVGLKSDSSNEFSGDGETKQEAEFTATVATRIVRRLPGNILQVEGARRIRVNNETQFLVVRGLLRQRDIGSTNTVASTSLAEAQIEIYGQGIITDKQRPGWLSRILDNIYPF